MTSAAGPLVRPRHVRAAGLCMGGAREWFRRRGLSWDAFVADGLPAAELEATGCPLAARAAAAARAEAGEA